MPLNFVPFFGRVRCPFRSSRFHSGQIPCNFSVQHVLPSNNLSSLQSAGTFRSMSTNSIGQKTRPKKRKKGKKRRTSNSSLDSSNSNSNDVDVDDYEMESLRIEEETRAWVKRVVVGLNLCPFAAKPLADNQLYITVVRGDDLEEILRQILAQSLVFVEQQDDDGKNKEKALPGTALVVCPDLVPQDFNEYLNVLTMVVDGLLEDYDLVGRVQVVPFHPRFVFAGDNNADDHNGDGERATERMDYYTNRSPYPMFHILKEDDVSKAIDLVKGDTDKIWQRNVHLLQRMEQLSEIAGANEEGDTDTRTIVKEHLQLGTDTKTGTAASVVKKALEETAKEFPLLQRPIGNNNETK